MFYLGTAIGFLAGVCFAWLARLWPALPPDLFQRFFRREILGQRSGVRAHLAEVEQAIAKQEGAMLSLQERLSRLEGALKGGGEARLPAREDQILNLPANPLHQKVIGLHRQGKDITEIARELGMGKGEVELTLAWLRTSGYKLKR